MKSITLLLYNTLMENRINFTLRPDTIENLKAYSQILDMDTSSLMENALEAYFAEIQKQMLEKNIADENAMTNLDYEEFWDGVDI